MSETKKLDFWGALGKVAKRAFQKDGDPVQAIADAATEVGAEIRSDVKRELDRRDGIVETTADPAPSDPPTVDESAKRAATG